MLDLTLKIHLIHKLKFKLKSFMLDLTLKIHLIHKLKFQIKIFYVTPNIENLLDS